MRRLAQGWAAAWLAGMLAACGGSSSPQAAQAVASGQGLLGVSASEREALQALHAQALAAGETEAIAYIGSVADELRPLVDEFAATFPGVRLNLQRLMGDKLQVRVDAEFSSGRRSADLIIGGLTDLLALTQAERLQATAPPTVGPLPARFSAPGGVYHVPYKKGFAIAYNPTLIERNALPSTIAELADPKWRNRFGYPGLGVAGPGDVVLALNDREGRLTAAQLHAIHENGVHGPPSSELVPQVAQGRLLFTVWTGAAAIIGQKAQGANVDIAFAPQLGVHLDTGVGLLKGAPRPHAARLAQAWLFTPRAQALLAELNFYGTMPDAPIPAGFPPLADYLNADLTENTELLALLTRFREKRKALQGATR